MQKNNADEYIVNLLALILLSSLKGETLREKALWLSLAGFSNVEIADFLQTSAQVVANALSEARKKTQRRQAK